MPTMVRKNTDWLAVMTAEMPWLPTNFPTISISAIEYSTCSPFESMNGMEKNSIGPNKGPLVKS